MAAVPGKVTKTYYIISHKDDLYEKGYYKDANGKTESNPTKGKNENGKWYFRFPQEFINSTNPRSIEVQMVSTCNPVVNGGNNMTGDIVFHTSFIKRDWYLDHACMIANQVRTKYKKYAYTSSEEYFEVWFTSFTNDKWISKFDETTFVIEMMLIY